MRVTTIPNHKLKTISKTDSVFDRGRRKGQGNNNTRGKMTWGKLVLRWGNKRGGNAPSLCFMVSISNYMILVLTKVIH